MDATNEIDYVDESSINGVPCDHLALRGDEVDLQVWVSQDANPLPQRIIITYKQVDGSPQFWGEFSSWNLSPKSTDALFKFTPPEDAEEIIFSPRQSGQTKEVSALERSVSDENK